MRLVHSALWASFVCLLSVLLALPANAAPSLDNTTCLTCHDGKKGKLEVAAADGKAHDRPDLADTGCDRVLQNPLNQNNGLHFC